MAGRIPENILEDILSRVDIVEVVSGFIPLKRAGRNFRALCPFHQEKTPSFMVSPDRQIYHCFGCFPSGSLIKTEKGFHKIEDMRVGQLVLTHQGRYMPVIRTLWRPYDGELIEIYTRKASLPVTLTSDHEVYVIKTKNCKYRSRENRICQWRCKRNCPAKFFNEYKIEKLQARQFSINDFLLYPINQQINDIEFVDLDKYYSCRESNFGRDIKSIPTKIEINERFLKLIGYWIAEGSNRRAYIRFSLGNHEKQFAKEIKELIEDFFDIKTSIHIRKKGNKTGIEMSACNSKLSNIFENLCGKLAENKHIPFELQNLSPKFQRIILDAIFKGDGHIGKFYKCKTDRQFKAITTVSLVLAEQLKDILLRLDISPTFSVEKEKTDKNNVKHKTAYTISWQENIKLHFSDIIKINNISYQIVPIRKIIERKFTGDVYNLTVAEDHSYTTPNFVVGNCGAGGNAFNFLMQYERLEFPEAVEALAKKVGISLPQAQKQDSQTASLITQIYRTNELTTLFYESLLNSSRGLLAKNYLLKRGINEATIKLFKLGFAPDKWDALMNHLRNKNINLSLMEKAGLVLPKEGGGYYDRFRNRIIFPIFDIKSRVLAFGGRVLPHPGNVEGDDTLPKYVNSPETLIYIKGRNLYGLNFARDAIRQNDYAVVVEGYLDFIMPYQAGLENVVASLGTALTPEQAQLIKRHTHNVVMVYDSDDAGEMATLRTLDIFIEEGMQVKVVSLPQGFDPDLFVRKNGIENFKEKINQAEHLFDYKLRILKARYSIKEIHGKARISAEMLPTIKRFKNAILKAEYIKRLAQELDIAEDAILQELKKIKEDKPYLDLHAQGPMRKTVNINPTEKLLMKLMLEETELINQIREKGLEPGDFQDERIARIVSLMFDLIDQGKNIEPNKLINYLDDETMAQVICESTLLPEISSPNKENIIDDCIKRIKSERLKLKKQRLHEEIKKAQTLRDEEQLRILMERFHGLIKGR
jgi:DNA primase